MTLSRARKRHTDAIFLKRTGIKVLLFFIFLIIIFFVVKKIQEIEQFPIRHVSVYGLRNLKSTELQHLLTPLVKKGFFAVEVDQIKEQLLRNAWIADVAVRRIWPDQVLITLFERKPVARWNDHSFLSSSGELFNPGNIGNLNLPQFVGPDGEHIHMLNYFTQINNILATIHSQIIRLELTSYFSWKITLNNGMKLSVGHKDILTRIGHFVKVYSKVVGARAQDVDYVDLRYSNGLAVKWKTVI